MAVSPDAHQLGEEPLTAWRGVLMADIAGARTILQKLLASKVRFVPEVVDGRAGFRLEAQARSPGCSPGASRVKNASWRPRGVPHNACTRCGRPRS